MLRIQRVLVGNHQPCICSQHMSWIIFNHWYKCYFCYRNPIDWAWRLNGWQQDCQFQYAWSTEPCIEWLSTFSFGEAAPHHVLWGSAQFLGWMPLFVFFGLPIVSCSLIKFLILGCLWLLVFVLNNILILGIWCSTIPHLPGCFCPWTFFENIGFNTVLTDPFMSHLATQLGYSAGEFQALQLIVLAAFGVVD